MLSFHYTGYSTIKDIASVQNRKRQKTEEPLCVVSLKLLADFWTLRIIVVLAKGEKRYCELQRALDNLNPVTLSNRLQKLEDAELVLRREEVGDKIAVSYQLTKRGLDALPIIDALNAFAKKHK